jgi:transposase
VPVIPSCLLEPLWDQFAALLPERPEVAPTHPLGCHRRLRIRADRHARLLGAHHSAPAARVGHRWPGGGAAHAGPAAVRSAYWARLGRPVGRWLHHQSPVWRGQGWPFPRGSGPAGPEAIHRHRRHRSPPAPGGRRSQPPRRAAAAVHAGRLGQARPPAGRGHRSPGPRVRRGYDGAPTRALLDRLGFTGDIARKGVPAPLQAGKRWVVERTHGWLLAFRRLTVRYDRHAASVLAFLYLACALVCLRFLRRAETW